MAGAAAGVAAAELPRAERSRTGLDGGCSDGSAAGLTPTAAGSLADAAYGEHWRDRAPRRRRLGRRCCRRHPRRGRTITADSAFRGAGPTRATPTEAARPLGPAAPLTGASPPTPRAYGPEDARHPPRPSTTPPCRRRPQALMQVLSSCEPQHPSAAGPAPAPPRPHYRSADTAAGRPRRPPWPPGSPAPAPAPQRCPAPTRLPESRSRTPEESAPPPAPPAPAAR